MNCLRLSIVTWQTHHIWQEQLGLVPACDRRQYQDISVIALLSTFNTDTITQGRKQLFQIQLLACSNKHSSLFLVCRADLLQNSWRRNTEAAASCGSYTYAGGTDCACCLLCYRSRQRHHWKLSQKLFLLLRRRQQMPHQLQLQGQAEGCSAGLHTSCPQLGWWPHEG